MTEEQKNLDKDEKEEVKGSGWVRDPEPKPEKPKEFVNVKWHKIGITIEGIYTKKKVDDVYGTTFFLEDKKDQDKIYSVPGTTDLNRKMKNKKRGDILKIEYVYDEDIGKPSPLKKFRIYSWKRGVP